MSTTKQTNAAKSPISNDDSANIERLNAQRLVVQQELEELEKQKEAAEKQSAAHERRALNGRLSRGEREDALNAFGESETQLQSHSKSASAREATLQEIDKQINSLNAPKEKAPAPSLKEYIKTGKTTLKENTKAAQQQYKESKEDYAKFKDADKKNVALFNKENAKCSKTQNAIDQKQFQINQIHAERTQVRRGIEAQESQIQRYANAIETQKKAVVDITDKLKDPKTFEGLTPKEIKLEKKSFEKQLQENKKALKQNQGTLKSETKNYDTLFKKGEKQDKKLQKDLEAKEKSKRSLVGDLVNQKHSATEAKKATETARTAIKDNPVYNKNSHLHASTQNIAPDNITPTKTLEPLVKKQVSDSLFEKPISKTEKQSSKKEANKVFEASVTKSKEDLKKIATEKKKGVEIGKHKQKQGVKLAKANAKLAPVKQEVKEKGLTVTRTQDKLAERQRQNKSLQTQSDKILETSAKLLDGTKEAIKQQKALEKQFEQITKKLKALESKVAKTEQKLKDREQAATAAFDKLKAPQSVVNHYEAKIKVDDVQMKAARDQIEQNDFTVARQARFAPANEQPAVGAHLNQQQQKYVPPRPEHLLNAEEQKQYQQERRAYEQQNPQSVQQFAQQVNAKNPQNATVQQDTTQAASTKMAPAQDVPNAQVTQQAASTKMAPAAQDALHVQATKEAAAAQRHSRVEVGGAALGNITQAIDNSTIGETKEKPKNELKDLKPKEAMKDLFNTGGAKPPTSRMQLNVAKYISTVSYTSLNSTHTSAVGAPSAAIAAGKQKVMEASK